MMKTKNMLIVLLSMFVLMFCMAGVNAQAPWNISSVTVTTPAASATISGASYSFIGSYIGNSSTDCNISVYVQGVPLCADITLTVPNTTWTCSGSTTGISDSQTAKVYAVAYNGSVLFANSSVVTVTIDNTAPTTPSITTSRKQTELYDPTGVKVICSGSDAYDTALTYSLTWTKPSGKTATSSEYTHIFEVNDLNEVGYYDIACTTTDDGSNSATKTLSNEVWISEDGEPIEAQTLKIISGKNTKIYIIGGIAILILGVIGIVIFITANQIMSSKKRKR